MHSLERIVTLCHDVRPSVRLSGTGVHCDHTVHVNEDLTLRLDSPMFWAKRDTINIVLLIFTYTL